MTKNLILWLFVVVSAWIHPSVALTACRGRHASKSTTELHAIKHTRLSLARRRYRDEEFEPDELSRQQSTDRPTLKQTQLIGPPIMPSKPKIVVLGASGRIGRLVVRQLLDMKHLDATIIACCKPKQYDKTIKVLYEDLTLASNQNRKGPRLTIVEADLVPPEELPGYLDEEEAEWRKRAESAAQFYNTSVSQYDNREDGGVAIVDANEALQDAIQDSTTIISCVGAVRLTNVWTDLLALPVWRWLRPDVSGWCKDPRHPYYVHYTSTRKVLGIAEREQLRREAAVEMALEEEDEVREEAVVVPKIRFIRVSDNCLSQNAWELVPLLTNIFRSMVLRYLEMADRLLESSSLIDTVILRPGDLMDEERDINTTHLQVDASGEVPNPSVVSREDVASLAVASALFRSPREKEAKMEAGSTEQHETEDSQQRQFAPFHCTLGVRWVGSDMHPYPAQGRKKDGFPTAQVALQKALKALKNKEKKEKRLQLRQRREQIFSDSASYPSRIAQSLQSRLRLKRQVKPYGIVSAIPIYLIAGLLVRSLGRVIWKVLCSKSWAQPVVGPVENFSAAALAFWMTNLGVVERFLASWLPRGLGRLFATKQYISF